MIKKFNYNDFRVEIDRELEGLKDIPTNVTVTIQSEKSTKAISYNTNKINDNSNRIFYVPRIINEYPPFSFIDKVKLCNKGDFGEYYYNNPNIEVVEPLEPLELKSWFTNNKYEVNSMDIYDDEEYCKERLDEMLNDVKYERREEISNSKKLILFAVDDQKNVRNFFSSLKNAEVKNDKIRLDTEIGKIGCSIFNVFSAESSYDGLRRMNKAVNTYKKYHKIN